jgi:predicted dithiol-disulfide oxidoreductase (DUF899 family)
MAKHDKHAVVSHEAWLAAREALLVEEKAYMRQGDEIARKRRELPWEKVGKAYAFFGPNGKVGLADLFGKHHQLIVYHFMFPRAGGTFDDDEGCRNCSFWADNFNGIDIHLAHRDAAFTAISRAPLAKIDAFKRRMGWSFSWVSSAQTDFNYDFQASFTQAQIDSGAAYYNFKAQEIDFADREGISVFYKDRGGDVFHTYSCYARGIEVVNGTYHFLDLTPKGRDEGGGPLAWVKYHDRYED